jgi:hypothetical protein
MHADVFAEAHRLRVENGELAKTRCAYGAWII